MDQVKKQALKSSMIKSGKRNFFFDVYEAVNNRKYLRITESRVPEKEGELGKRTSMVLFPESISEFQTQLSEAAKALV